MNNDNKIENKPIVSPLNSDPVLSHILESNHKTASERNSIAENHLQATSLTNKLLENEVEASAKMIEKLSEIADEIKPQEILDKATFIVKGVKGDPGKDGHTPTDDELLTLIKPLIPQVKDGKTPTNDELLALIRPLIPKVKDGITPSDEKLLSLITPLINIPEPIPGHTPTDSELLALIKPLIPKKDKQLSAEDIVALIRGKIKYEDIIGVPNLDVFRRQSSKTVSLVELDDVNLTGLSKTNGKYNLGSGSGSGGNFIYNETPSGTKNDINVTFTLMQSPNPAGSLLLTLNGQVLTQNDDYTLSGSTITMIHPPSSTDTLYAQQYQY